MKYNIDRKENGSSIVSGFIVAILTILTAYILINMFISYNIRSNLSTDIDIIMRKYIVIMESDGYLTTERADELKNDLAELGLRDIDLSGSTSTEVEYGGYVTLSLSASADTNVYNLNNLTDARRIAEEYEITKKLTSTSQK